jgi:hypothetical protein
MVVSGQLHAPAALHPGKVLGTHWIGGWVGTKAGLYAVVRRNKSHPMPGIERRLSSP